MALGNVQLIAAVKELIAAFRAKGKSSRRSSRWAHAIAGCRPDDPRPGIRAFAETLAGEVKTLEVVQFPLSEINMGRRQSARSQRAAGYAEKCTSISRRSRASRSTRARSDRGDSGHAGVRLVLLDYEEPGDQALEGVQRPPAAVVGPRCGLREINLPAKQPGSSIMPGKVNPVIPEVVNMVCFRVIGSDLTVTMAPRRAASAERLRTVIAACIFEPDHVHQRRAHAARALRGGHHGESEILQHYVNYSIGTVTALNR